MAYLIDGYNLLFALGLLQKQAGPAGLERARARLIAMISVGVGERAGEVTVVFDAGQAAPNFPRVQQMNGIHVRFSTHPNLADDVIEELIEHHAAPRQLTVISDDRRLKRAARRRHCRTVGCLDFMDELGRIGRAPSADVDDQKRPPVASDEQKMWLSEFADLEQEMRKLSDPLEFLDFDLEDEKDRGKWGLPPKS